MSTPKVGHVRRLPAIRFAGLSIRQIFQDELGKSANVMHEALPRMTRLPSVRHRRTSELVYCLRGRFTVELNGKKIRLKAGNIVWIPPLTWHTFQTYREDAEALSIFLPDLFARGKPDVETAETGAVNLKRRR